MEFEELRGVLVSVAKAPYREARVEREAGLGFGLRLFQLAEIRQRRGEEEMRQRDCTIVLDGATKQCDRLLVGAKSHLRGACEMQPEPGKTVARREAQSLFFMRLGFFGATDKHLGQTDVSMSCRQIRVQRQRPLEFGDALLRTVGLVQDAAHDLVGQRIVRPLREHLGYCRFTPRRGARPGRRTDRRRPPNSRPARRPAAHRDCWDRALRRAQNSRAPAPCFRG